MSASEISRDPSFGIPIWAVGSQSVISLDACGNGRLGDSFRLGRERKNEIGDAESREPARLMVTRSELGSECRLEMHSADSHTHGFEFQLHLWWRQ
jgi:hypothetical protein